MKDYFIEKRFFDEHFALKTLYKDDCVIHYWVSRANDAPWLIFLHGACADHRSFYPQLPAVYKDYHVLLWDARNHGLSRPAAGFCAKLLLSDLCAVMEKESIKKATLIGHSAGGNLAQAFAREFPEKVESLVIIDSTWNTQKLNPFEKWAVKRARVLLSLYSWKALVEQSAKVSSAKPEVREYLKESFSLLGKEEYIRIFCGITDFVHEDADYRINKRILLIVGEKDKTGNIKKAAPLFAAAEPQCTYAVLKNAWHTSNMDNPEEVNILLTDFLDKQYHPKREEKSSSMF